MRVGAGAGTGVACGEPERAGTRRAHNSVIRNPPYAYPTRRVASQSRQAEGWGERVDKTHFNSLNEMSSFAEAALRLGEKPFKGGSMK